MNASVPLSHGTAQRVAALFTGVARVTAAELLVEQCGDNLPLWVKTDPQGLERIRFAVLKLSGGDLAKLTRAVRMAQRDWRDVLVAAGFANSIVAHESWFPASETGTA